MKMACSFLLLTLSTVVALAFGSNQGSDSANEPFFYVKTKLELRSRMENENSTYTWEEINFGGKEFIVTNSSYLSVSVSRNGIEGWVWRPRQHRWERVFQAHVYNASPLKTRLNKTGMLEFISGAANSLKEESVFSFDLRAATI